MKILLIAGHGDGDSGAVGNGYKEADLTREVVSMVSTILSKYATVDIYPTKKSCYKDLTRGIWRKNFKNYNYVLEVHFNAGGGTGTEIYVTTREKSVDVEKAIVNNLSKYYKNRGVKRTNFLVINTAKSYGVSSALLEVCFIDNANDVNTYVNNKYNIANAIVKGIVDGFKLGNLNQVSKPTPSEKVDQILHIGSNVKLNGIYKIDGVSAKYNGIICKKLVGQPPYSSYHYIDASICTEVDINGVPTKDQICDTNHYVKINGTFKVLKIDNKTNSCKLKIGKREVWIYCEPCTEV